MIPAFGIDGVEAGRRGGVVHHDVDPVAGVERPGDEGRRHFRIAKVAAEHDRVVPKALGNDTEGADVTRATRTTRARRGRAPGRSMCRSRATSPSPARRGR